MRTDIPESSSLFFSRDGFAGKYKIEVQQNRQAILESEFDLSRKVSFSSSPGYSASPVPQDSKTIDDRVTVVYVHDGVIKLQDILRAQITPTYLGSSLQADVNSRPSIIDNDDTTFYVYYVNQSSQICRATIYKAPFSVSTSECVIAIDNIGSPLTVSSAALHAVSSSLLVTGWIDDGGVRVRIYVDETNYNESLGRIIHPIEIYDADLDADCILLNYSAAVEFGDQVFFYLSAFDGNVIGMYYDKVSETWSDTFEAVAADLSRFSVANAENYHGKIIMAGQFTREDPVGAFSSTYVYNLVLTSTDGKIFTINRSTMVTYGDYDDGDYGAMRFFVCGIDRPTFFYDAPGPALLLQSFGIWASVRSPYSITPNQVEYTIDEVYSIAGSANEGWTIGCGFIDQDILDDIHLGDSVNIYMSPVRQDGSREWFLLQEAILSRKGRSYEDGKVTTTLGVESFSSGLLNDMTWPIYTELQGKQSIRDSMEDFSNMYKAAEEGYLILPFMVDFWSEGSLAPVGTNPLEETEVWTSDLMSAYSLVDYPEIAELPFDIECYGWSRAGKTTNLTTGGDDVPSPTDAPNATIGVKITIDRDGEEFTYAVRTSDSPYFPQTWYEYYEGNYPVIIQAVESDGFVVGDKIKKIAMLFTSEDTDCLSYPERIEIPEIGMHVASFDETWKPVERVDEEETGSKLLFVGSGQEAGGCDTTISVTQLTGGEIQFTVNFLGNDPFPRTAGYALLGLDPAVDPWSGFADLSYDVIGDCPSVEYDAIGNHPPDWEYYVYSPPYDLPVINTPIEGGWHVQYGAIYSPFSDNIFKVGWGDVHGGRWAGRTVATRVCVLKNFTISGVPFTPVLVQEVEKGQELMQVGIPVVYFSTKPYFTINCEVAAKYYMTGAQSNVGVVCCAHDGQNYIAARATLGKVQLVKVRGGIETVLAEENNTWAADGYSWIKLKLQDGVFKIFTRPVYDVSWGDGVSKYWSDPILVYEWKETDGEMLVNKDISHVGIYALRDAPMIRITGFDRALGSRIGVAPGSPDIEDFPVSGSVRIDGVSYSYSSISDIEEIIRGPYQGRNVSGPYSYSDFSGNAAEYTHFNWTNNETAHEGDVWSHYIAVESGFAWPIDAVDWQPAITTHGVRINLKNRCRTFSSEANGDVIGMGTRIWETCVLDGITRIDGEETTHAPYSLAILDSESKIILYEFAASSGHGPLTDRDMLDIICKLSGARPEFVADKSFDEIDLSSTPYKVSE
jgi:hypothetical protein